MNRPSNIIPLHRYAGYRRRIPNEHIARALGDVDDILREAVKADNLRRFREAHPANDAERICRASAPLHETRQYRIGPAPHPVAMTALDVIACLLVAFAIGFMLAAGSM